MESCVLQVPVFPSEHDTGSFQLAQLGLRLLNCKLSENGEKCSSQFPKAQGDIFKSLLLSCQQPNPQKLMIYFIKLQRFAAFLWHVCLKSDLNDPSYKTFRWSCIHGPFLVDVSRLNPALISSPATQTHCLFHLLSVSCALIIMTRL